MVTARLQTLVDAAFRNAYFNGYGDFVSGEPEEVAADIANLDSEVETEIEEGRSKLEDVIEAVKNAQQRQVGKVWYGE